MNENISAGRNDDLKEDNRRCIDAFTVHGETITLIESDYEETIGSLKELAR